jgi:hypothetical protein
VETAVDRTVEPAGERTSLLDDRTAPIDEAADARPYFAVVREVPGTFEAIPAAEALVADRRSRRGAERFATDIPVAVVAAMLAATTFLPWYKGPKGYGISATGWGSGTWGPLIFFLAAGSFALVVLRRVGVAVSLPVEESLFHEGAGWIALVGAVIKSRARPGQAGALTAAYGVWIAIGLAAVLIVLAGRMSPHAPLVVRPGWHKARAGIVGLLVLGVVVAGSAVFGAINTAKLTPASTGGGDVFGGTIQGKLPDCAKDFPLPPGLKPQYGFGTGPACQAQLTSTKPSADVAAAARAVLKQKKYVFTEDGHTSPDATIFTITKPRCATLVVVPAESGSLVALGYTACASPTPG